MIQHKPGGYRPITAILLLFLLPVLLLFSGRAEAFDEENCLFCHKYRGLCYIDKDKNFRLLYVTEDLYEKSPHGILKCSECHHGIDKFPHTNIKKVDCLSVCHVDEPSSQKPFSHQNVAKHLDASVHSEYLPNGELKEHPEDYPKCLTCHMDPLYRPLAFLENARPGIAEKTIARCSICHEAKDFMAKFYNHFTSRMQSIRTPKELAEKCGECHNDPGIQKRHKLRNVVHSYFETYHGKAVYFGDERAADCNDCHTRHGESIHSIKSGSDPESATYVDNLPQTCGEVACHPEPGIKLSSFNPHVVADPKVNPVEYYVLVFFVFLTAGSFGAVMLFNIMDMIRKIFPNAALIKKEDKTQQ